jgi:hypothetical protein
MIVTYDYPQQVDPLEKTRTHEPLITILHLFYHILCQLLTCLALLVFYPETQNPKSPRKDVKQLLVRSYHLLQLICFVLGLDDHFSEVFHAIVLE